MATHSTNQRVWFITGTSQGFGHELVRAALPRGDSVVATSRAIPGAVVANFPKAADRDFLVMPMDLGRPAEIAKVVEAAVDRFRRIDVLVNNAGFGIVGAVEEASDAEIDKVFEINVFGLLRVTGPCCRSCATSDSGTIVIFSSIGGLVGFAGFGIYNATKFAVEGLSEALAKEAAPLGIHVLLVEPGPYRTDFSAARCWWPRKKLPTMPARPVKFASPAARATGTGGRSRAGRRRHGRGGYVDSPPLHFLLGAYAYRQATKKLDALRADMDR